MQDSNVKRFARRDFLRLAASGLAVLPVTSLTAATGDTGIDIRDMIIINALGGLSNQNLWLQSQDRLQESIGKSSIRRMRSIDRRAIDDTLASGTTAINATLGYVAGPGDPYEYTVDDIATWNAIIHQYPDDMLKVWRAADIRRASQDRRVGIIYGFQNAACLGERVERVRTFANLGVRIIQLTYNDRNQIGDGSAVAENRGLSKIGFELVEALNEQRVLVDLSHSGEQTCLDAVRASKTAITISHTGCRALNDVPRNKSDAELRLVAEKGGVVGIYFMPFLRKDGQARADDVVAHLEHALQVCGEDHVGIGTDGDATAIDDMQAYRAAIAGEVRQRQQAGVSASGESSQVVPLIPDLMGPNQFQKLASMLYRRGHSRQRIEKILGGNFLRLMQDVWPG